MDKELTFVEHLDELRRRVIIALVALGAASIVSMPFAPALLRFLKEPASGTIEKLAFFGPQEAFVIYMRIGFLAGVIIAFPVIAYELWKFISPAVDEKFKRYAARFIIACSAAFILGCLFAYFILLPAALKFLLSFGSDDLQAVISADRYISFVVGVILCSGAVFEMPVLSFTLTKMGLLNASILKKKWKIAVVAIFVTAAVITPTTDVFNMAILAAPMMLSYAVSIWISAVAKPRAHSSTG